MMRNTFESLLKAISFFYLQNCIPFFTIFSILMIPFSNSLTDAADFQHKQAAIKATNRTTPNEKQISEMEKRVLFYTNKERWKNGLQALEVSPALKFLARHHSKNMCKKKTLEHESDVFPQGWRTFQDRLKIANLNSGAENIAYRTNMQVTDKWAQEVVAGWMKSSTHKKNILNPKHKYIGIGVVACSDRLSYATQVFSSESGRVP